MIAVRSQVGTYCRSLPPNSTLLTAPNCVKNQIPSVVSSAVESNVAEMEKAHWSVFLGLNGVVKKLADPATYSTWANDAPTLNYSLYLDTDPPKIAYEQKGLWQLGNRIMAAGREMMYLISTNTSDEIYASRPYKFLHDNADVTLYGYERSLDHLMVYASDQITSLYDSAVILMVFEALVIIPLCALGLFLLIHRTEAIR